MAECAQHSSCYCLTQADKLGDTSDTGGEELNNSLIMKYILNHAQAQTVGYILKERFWMGIRVSDEVLMIFQ